METPAQPRLGLPYSARVLVVDNEEEYRQLYRILLEHWGYKPFVATGEGQALLENAVHTAQANRCQLALVDMRLLDNNDSDDLSGLELIPRLKPTQSIVVSAFGNHRSATISIKQKGAVSFVGKEEGADRLQEELTQAAARYCVGCRQLDILPADLGQQVNQRLFPGRDDVAEDEPAELLGRLFPEARRLSLERLDDPERQPSSRVPRPRSMVLLARPDDFQPVVVKLARAHKVKKEIDRYREYIENRLYGNFSPPLKNWDMLWAVGGMVYPFIGATSVETFTRYYAAASPSAIERGLEKFFKRTWSSLYAAPRGERRPNIFEAYCAVWDRDWFDQRLTKCPFILPPQGTSAQWQHLQVPNPLAWLSERLRYPADLPQTALAITHGDLHGDNMLVDDNGNIWVIDFERSGPGPVLQDFVELETDIITRLVNLPEEDFGSFYTLCWLVSQPTRLGEHDFPASIRHPQLSKAAQVIAALRRLARECTGEFDSYPYLWSMLLNVLFRISLLDAEAQQRSYQRAVMFGSILCHRLEHWGETWPPAEWPIPSLERQSSCSNTAHNTPYLTGKMS